MKTKKSFIFRIQGLLFGFILVIPPYLITNSYAAVSSYTMSQFTSYPINIAQNSVPPMVMLNTSRDHQLYFKAYNDYTDLDGDGFADTTYKHSIDYYGYFDSYKCYTYNTTNSRFEPVSTTTDKYCASGQYWSGNFLNWATMTRIDVVRKVLFGGHRRVDTSTDTVLERAYLPHESHSFAKLYQGADLAQLTPFTPGTTAGLPVFTTTSATSNSIFGTTSSSTSLTLSGTTTSTTSRSIPTIITVPPSSMNFTMATSGQINAGDTVRVRKSSDDNNYMQGTATTVSGTTLTLTITSFAGSCSNCTSWEILPIKTFTVANNGDANGQIFSVNGNGFVRIEKQTDPTKYMEGKILSVATNTTITMRLEPGRGTSGGTSLNNWDVLPFKTFSYSTTNGIALTTGDWVKAVPTANPNRYMIGQLGTSSGAGWLNFYMRESSGTNTPDSTSYPDWTLYKLTGGITLCNTTDTSTASPPLIKVASGNYALWASHEVWQCTWQSGAPADNKNQGTNGNTSARYITTGIYANEFQPTYSIGLGSKEYNVRVKACVTGLIGQEKCKAYPSGNYKPIGLLQTYGDNDQIKFGMMAGSYVKNKTGGDLIYDIGSMSREINVDTNGIFYRVSSDAGGPVSNGTAAPNNPQGIINAWSLFKLAAYNHSGGSFSDNCGPGKTSFNNSECSNWGNPYAEIYLNSLRYLAGLSRSTAFQADDTSKIPGLNRPSTWNCPLNSTNYCSNLSIINFNASTISYDNDDLDGSSPEGVSSIGSSQTSTQLTNTVGTGEGISGNYFVGENGTNIDQLCTSKSVTNFGAIDGICPDAARLLGTYRLAGLAYYAHTNDLRPDSAGARALTGNQKVDNYSVALATNVPKIVIPVPGSSTGQTVTLLPASRTATGNGHTISPPGNGAMANFKLIYQNNAFDTGVGTGKYYVQWEDSEQGSDFDTDIWGILSYRITNTSIQVTTDVVSQTGGISQGHGYIISGTTNDGFHVHSGGFLFSFTDPSPPSIIEGHNCQTTTCGSATQGAETTDAPSTASYTIGTSSTRLFNDPLWYTAKWGDFTDSNNNNIPDLQSEWDKKNTSLQSIPDGIPDNFFYASNPAYLEDSLNKVFLSILQRVSSGTAAAAVSSTASGLGSGYQAYYEPSKQDTDGNKATWIGSLRALWLDNYGRLREDGNQDAILNGYDLDPVIEFFYDETDSRTKVRRYSSSNASSYAPVNSTVIELGEIKPIWNAREQLYYRSVTNLAAQRNWTSTADSGRYILTNANNTVDSGDLKDFTATALNTTTNFGLFDVASKTEADNLISFIRGVEISGKRNRTVDYDNDGTTEVMRLGDIVNSTPTVVAMPQESFDLLYGDTSYATFRKIYAHRRHVVYVGANDGMLHAFNGGFYDVPTSSFKTTGTQVDGSPAIEHPLGSELWAYIPGNLLPHLKWLQDPNYTHVYYVDGKPRVFDVKIFTDDENHPGGWGTILVVGMNFGGGTMNNISVNGANRNFRSSYSILDITNPEKTPTLLAEIQLPDGSFTTVYPTAMSFKCSIDATSCTDTNQWYLILGSGPNNFTTGESSNKPTLYIYDLNTRTLAQSYLIDAANTFLGNPVTADWDLDYRADNVYFGLIGATAGNVGKLMRFNVKESETSSNWIAPHVLLDVTKPVLATPIVTIDEYLNHWIFFGTGRLFVSADKSTTAQQALYGIKDKNTAATNDPLALTDLIDSSNINVYTDGSVDTAPTGISTFQALKDLSDTGGNANPTCTSNCKWGWLRNLNTGTDPSERNLVQMALVNSLLFAPAYTPNTDQCAPEGKSKLYALYYKTGTAYFEPALGTDSFNGKTRSLPSIDLGRGFASTPTVHSGSGMGPKKVTVLDQGSTGAITNVSANTTSSVRSGETSWRKYQEK